MSGRNVFTDSKFKIDEISVVFRSKGLNSTNYFSIFMGTYEPIGSDIFLRRQFGIQPIMSKITESWLGIAGSVIYPLFGMGIADVVHFSTQPLDSAVPDENQDSVHADTNGYYEIFTRKTCPNCPPVKDFMSNLEMPGRSIDVDTEEGLAEAAGKGVFASPTVIVYDSEGNETARAHNVEELSVIFAKITVGA